MYKILTNNHLLKLEAKQVLTVIYHLQHNKKYLKKNVISIILTKRKFIEIYSNIC